MKQQQFIEMINSGQQIYISNEIMEAAQQSARIARSQALQQGSQWLATRMNMRLRLLRSNKSSAPQHCMTP